MTTLKIRPNGRQNGYSIEVDGTDIAQSVVDLALDMEPGFKPRVAIVVTPDVLDVDLDDVEHVLHPYEKD